MIIALVLIGLLFAIGLVVGINRAHNRCTGLSDRLYLFQSGDVSHILAKIAEVEKKLSAFAATEQLGWGIKETQTTTQEEGWIPLSEVEKQRAEAVKAEAEYAKKYGTGYAINTWAPY